MLHKLTNHLPSISGNFLIRASLKTVQFFLDRSSKTWIVISDTDDDWHNRFGREASQL